MQEKPPAFGFLLVTVDPTLNSGRKGCAWHLVRDRLTAGRWPLFERTPGRGQIAAESRVAFYVGGRDKYAGSVVAIATVARKVSWSAARGRIDPPRFDTELPEQVLTLSGLQYLHPSVSFRETLPRLTFCPVNMQKWGAVLLGGVRALSEVDWGLLFDGTSLKDEPHFGHAEGSAVGVKGSPAEVS